MKRIQLPNQTDVQGLQFSQADTAALMTLLIDVSADQITQSNRTFAKLLILRYGYFLAEMERQQTAHRPTDTTVPNRSPRTNQRGTTVTRHRKRKGGRR